MTMKSGIARLAALVLAVVALALPVRALAGELVPFKGSDRGSWGVDASDRCGSLLPVWVETSGKGLHVGRYTYSSRECADLGAGTYAGAFTLTAANGDTIVGHYAGTFTADASNIYYEQTNTIEGGTGRFAGASGSFHVSGIAALDGSGADVQRAKGAISSVGSS
jgi:hypothetical protein